MNTKFNINEASNMAEHTSVNYANERNVEYDEAVAYLESLGIVAENKTQSPAEVYASKDKKIISEMEEKTGIKYSDEQRAVLMYRGNAHIIACAGSGKTTTLAHLISKRIKSGEIADASRMVCTTFSKDGAKDLKKRVMSVLKDNVPRSTYDKLNDVRICTLHAFFLELLRTFGSQAKVITEIERVALVKEACKTVYSFIDKDDVDTINQLLSYQVNKLYSDADTVKHLPDLKCEIDEQKYAKIRHEFARKKAEQGVIDFDDMQLILYQWIVMWENSQDTNQRSMCEQMKNYCHEMFKYYFIDEAQDISEIQFAIIKALTLVDGKACCNVVFVGDDDQSIYSWRGSNSNIIMTLGNKYMNMSQFKLTTNRRCADNILKFAREGIENNLFRYGKEMKSIHEGGVVHIEANDGESLYNYSKCIVNYIMAKREEGYRDNEIAVLCRNNMHACLVPYMLAEKGVYCNTRKEMRIVNNITYKDLKDIMDICLNEDTVYTIKRVLWKLVPYMSTAKCSKLASEASAVAGSFGEYLEMIFGDKGSASTKSMMYNSLASILSGNRLIDSIREIYRTLCNKDEAERITNMMYVYMNNTFGYLYKSEDMQRIIRGMVKYMTEQIKEKGVERAVAFFHMMEQLDKGDMAVPGDKIEISTIHSAKGREWDCVAIIACDLIGFPDRKNVESFLVESELNEFLDEERRLFYVGCTRARKDLFIATTRYDDKVSPYIMEAVNVDRGEEIPNKFVSNACAGGYTSYELADFKSKVDKLNKECEVKK